MFPIAVTFTLKVRVVSALEVNLTLFESKMLASLPIIEY